MAAKAGGVKAGKAFVLIEAVDKTAFVLRRIGQKIKAFAGRMQSMGQSMVQKAVAGLIPAALATRSFASFDDAMRKVEARSSGTARQMKDLRTQAKELGRTTSFTATEVANLQAALAQKGFSRTQIQDTTGNVLNLARSAGEGSDQDTILAAQLVSGTIRAFGKEASESGNIADVFSAAVNNSNQTLDGLLTSMATAGPVAKKYRIGLEETVATLSGMTNLNIDASTAGTAFRNMLLKMSDAAGREKFNKALKEATGNTVDFVDEAGNLRSLPQLLFDVGDAVKNLGTAEQGDLLNQLFGLRAIVPAGALSEGREGFTDLLEILQNAGGTAEDTAKKMDAGIGGSFRRFMSAVEGVAIAIGESLAPALSKLTEWLTGNMGTITEWVEAHRGMLVAVFGGILAFGLLGAALWITGTAISLVGSLFTGLASAMMALKAVAVTLAGVLMSPWGIVAAAVAGVIALLWKFSQSFREIITGIGSFVADKFQALTGTLVDTFQGVMDALAAGDFQKAWDIAVEGLSLVWLQVVDMMKAAWENFTGFFVEAWIGAVATVKTAFLKLQKTISKSLMESAAKGSKLAKLFFIGTGVDPEEEQKRMERLNAQAAKLGLGEQDTLDQALQGLEDHFNDKIAKASEDAGNALAEHTEGIRQAQTERQKEIDARRKSLNELLNAQEDRKAAEESMSEAQDQAATQAQSRLDDMMKDLAVGQVRSPEVQRGLEQGSMEAAQAFFQNRAGRDFAAEQLEEQRQMKEALQRIDKNLAGGLVNVNTA